MQRIIIVSALAAVAVTSSTASPYVYSQPGHHYRLSSAELAEINRLVEKRRDILKPIDAIGMLGPDYAQVSSGAPQRDGDPTTWFHIRKKKGKWTIEESRVTSTRAVFTD